MVTVDEGATIAFVPPVYRDPWPPTLPTNTDEIRSSDEARRLTLSPAMDCRTLIKYCSDGISSGDVGAVASLRHVKLEMSNSPYLSGRRPG